MSASHAEDRLVALPGMPWDGPFPYDVLSAARIRAGGEPLHPGADASEINDLLFDLMVAGKPDPVIHEAWNELRVYDRRVAVDFFLFSVGSTHLDPDDDQLWCATIVERPLPIEDLLDVGADLGFLGDTALSYRTVAEAEALRYQTAADASGVELGPLAFDGLELDPNQLYEVLEHE